MSHGPDNQLKALWKGQEAEAKPMSIEAIRALVRRARMRRRRSIVALCAMGAFAVPMFAWRAWVDPGPLIRAGFLVELVGIGWLLWRGVRIWLRPPPEDSTATVLMDLHRAQLIRQRQAGGFRGAIVTSAPILVGLLMMLAGLSRYLPASHRSANMSVLIGLLALWFIGMAALTVLSRRKLQARVDGLDDPEHS